MSKLRVISTELQEKARKELNEVPSRIPEDLQHIKDWIKKQPHLNARMDDQWLLSFLRGCKFSLERTKEKLDMYYTMRSLAPEFYSNRDPLQPELQEILQLGLCLPLPKLSNPAAPRVILLRNGAYDPAKVNIANLFKVNMLIQDVLVLEDDNYIIAGEQIFQDQKEVSMNHFLQISPSMVKKAMTCIQQAYPARPKGVHFINIPSFFEMIHNMFKPFLSEKIKRRIKIYSDNNLEELYKVIPKNILPEEYGGEGGKIDEIKAIWKKKVEDHRDWFLEDAQYCTTESRRPGKPKTCDDVFGIEGSFRKLNVD